MSKKIMLLLAVGGLIMQPMHYAMEEASVERTNLAAQADTEQRGLDYDDAKQTLDREHNGAIANINAQHIQAIGNLNLLDENYEPRLQTLNTNHALALKNLQETHRKDIEALQRTPDVIEKIATVLPKNSEEVNWIHQTLSSNKYRSIIATYAAIIGTSALIAALITDIKKK